MRFAGFARGGRPLPAGCLRRHLHLSRISRGCRRAPSKLPKRTGARIIRVFSYWRPVRAASLLRASRASAGAHCHPGGATWAHHRSGKRARMQHRHWRRDGPPARGSGASESEGRLGSGQCLRFGRNSLIRMVTAACPPKISPTCMRKIAAWRAASDLVRAGRWRHRLERSDSRLGGGWL